MRCRASREKALAPVVLERWVRMARERSTDAARRRSRMVGRLSAIFGYAVLLQAAAFLLFAWAYRSGVRALLDLSASSTGSAPGPGAELAAAAGVMIFDLFFALLIGFFGARFLLRAIRKATPAASKPPREPIPLAALCAGALVAAISILQFVAHSEEVSSVWYGWAFELVRDAVVVFLLWFAARKAVLVRKPV